MNVERLHALALGIRQDLDRTNSQATLQQLAAALQNQVNEPRPCNSQPAPIGGHGVDEQADIVIGSQGTA